MTITTGPGFWRVPHAPKPTAICLTFRGEANKERLRYETRIGAEGFCNVLVNTSRHEPVV